MNRLCNQTLLRADRRSPIGLRILVLAILLAGAVAGVAEAAKRAPFTVKPDIETGRIFDFGVADYNDDGNLDLFTTNHKYLGSVLAGDGNGRFQPRLGLDGLSQTPAFPGVEDLLTEPAQVARGLYIYLDSAAYLHVVTVGLDQIVGYPDNEVSGSVKFFAETYEVQGFEDVELSSRSEGSGATKRTIVDFTAQADSFAVFKAPHMDLPFTINVEGLPLGRIFVGSEAVNPAGREFEITLRDRHGMAWGDLNRDTRSDVFITSGGLGGAIAQYQGLVTDELFLGGGGGFTESATALGLRKGGCRARGAALVDYSLDGRLDLFAACKGSTPLLQRALPGGGFAIDGQDLDQLNAVGTEYRWLDINDDRRPELIVAGAGKFRVFGRRPDGSWFLRQQLRTRDSGKQTNGLSFADYDADGDPDLFLVARSGNTLLVNRGKSFRAVDPDRVGLPRGRSFSVNWVDANNDARPDLHLMPKGLFRQRRDGTFRETRRARSTRKGQFGIASWPDLDNDGSRDPILIIKRGGIFARAGLAGRPSRRWIEVDLVGPPGNRDAIGAKVTVRSKDFVRTGWVGESEGSRYSTGHYRVYFGLDDVKRVNKLIVDWPDGYQSLQKVVASNQVKVIAHPRSLP